MESDLIRAWTRRAGDPDTDLADWVEKGTPLGVNLEIKPRGIFPPADKEGEPEVMMDASCQIARGAVTNYASHCRQPGRHQGRDQKTAGPRVRDEGVPRPSR